MERLKSSVADAAKARPLPLTEAGSRVCDNCGRGVGVNGTAMQQNDAVYCGNNCIWVRNRISLQQFQVFQVALCARFCCDLTAVQHRILECIRIVLN